MEGFEMKMHRITRAILAAAAALMLASVPALAEEAGLTEKSLELGNSSIRYPEIAGMADETLQQLVNEQIQADLGVDGYLQRIMTLISEENLYVRVEWDGAVNGDVLSCVLSAEGALENSRSTHRWTWSNIDLRDGHGIAFDELFKDGEEARTALEEYLDWEVAPELSAHLGNSELTPLPDGFRLEKTGLTLLYPVASLSTLKDRAGDIRIGWNEIRDVLDLEEDSVPARIGAADMITLTEGSADRIREMTESGQLTDIPVHVGDGLRELTDRYHLLTDPDVYEGGRMFALEGGYFRDVYLLTDHVNEQWDDSVVQGIRMDRGCAWGLCIGQTSREEWQEILGEPEYTAALDADKAEAWRREPGECDYYRFGEYQLQLYSDAEGTLVSITLAE